MATAAELHIAKFAAAKIKNPDTGFLSSAYELQLLQLKKDRARLKAIESVEAKIELKKQIVPHYEAWISGVLSSGSGMQDDVFMHLLVWTLDIGDITGALPMARYALAHNLVTPDQYVRRTATLIADEVGDTSLKMMLAEKKISSVLLLDYIQLLAAHDMPDQVRAKIHKAAGCALEAENNLAAALTYLERALELDTKCGVKKQIEGLRRKLKKQQEAQNLANAKNQK